MDTSDTINGQRERALADGVVDSDISTQSAGEKCRVGVLHSAFVADKGVVKEHAQWRHCAMKRKIATQPRKAPGPPFVTDGGGLRYRRMLPEGANEYWGRS